MPTNALANPLVLPILGLLAERPRHAYAIFTELRSRYAYLAVRNATVYTLLDALTETGWLRSRSSRGDRIEYRLSASGHRTLVERVDEELRFGDLADDTGFMTALAYLGIMPPASAVGALRERSGRIQAEIKRVDRALAAADEVPELHMIEAHFYRDRLRHIRRWLDETVRRIESGALGWPDR